MLTESDLHELLEMQTKHPVLSVYLNTEQTKESAEYYKLQLRSMLKEANFKDDVFAIERFIEHEYDWSGRSLAIFSCAPEKFFRAYPLAVPVRSRIRIGNQPHVKPLADILDAYGGYGVVLVDKQGARLFYFHLGNLIEQEGTLGESIRRTKQGGASTYRGRRGGMAGQTKYVEEATERNMREVVEFASNFFAHNNARRILIGGTDDNVALFKSILPKSWQSLVVGNFPISMTASKDEVLEKALEIGQEAERRREAKLVTTVLNGAAKGRNGVTTLDNTLSALRDGRVQTLLIREGYRAPGYRCLGCGYLTAKRTDSCSFCGNQFEDIPDAVELAVHEVMKLGGEIEVLHDGELPEQFGNIGALLRY
jgi:peptide chain release factor subunit 1